jgi:hypothetical protein
MTQTQNRPLTVWLPPDLIEQVAAQAARRSAEFGARYSKSAWVASAIRRALADAESPAQPAAEVTP